MEFSKKKLAKDLIESLYRMRIDSVQPFALMFSPVYVLLKENQKFVSVKAPLDFFTPDELKRLLPYTYFYVPEFVLSVVPFREAGQNVRSILKWDSSQFKSTKNTLSLDVELDPPSYENSDAILRKIGPLWWEYPEQGPGVEPFLVAVFVNELCDLLPSSKLQQAREIDAGRFEMALLLSSWVVFLALHLGYCDLQYLNDIRLDLFNRVAKDDLNDLGNTEIEKVISVAMESLPSNATKLLKVSFFEGRDEKISHKLSSRLARITQNFISKGQTPPSIFGERGFIDG